MAARIRHKKRNTASNVPSPESAEPQLELFRESAGRSTKYFFSTRLEHLLAGLARELNETRSLDFFARAPVIWIPNRNLRRWVQMELARESHVAAHLDFQFLESGLWKLLVALDPDRETPQSIDRTDLEFLTLSVLEEIQAESGGSVDQGEVFAPFLEYLARETGAGESSSRRIYQLALRLAALFQEYEYHRADMVAAWSEVPALSAQREADAFATFESEGDPERRGVYFAERAVYRRVFGIGSEREGGRVRSLDRYGNRALSLAAYARAVLIERRAGLQPLNQTVHIFGMSQMSAFHLTLLSELSEYLHLRFYLPFVPQLWSGGHAKPVHEKPSREESWQEVEPPAIIPDESAQVIAPASVDDATRLNDLWGRPARELLVLLSEHRRAHHKFYWDGHDWAAYHAARAGNLSDNGVASARSLLAAARHNLLYGAPFSEREVLKQDTSVQIIGCPGLRREAETIYQNILFNMERDASLRLTDIAILVPDMRTYRPVLQAVFDAEREPGGQLRVPYNLTDFSAGDASVYGAGLAALLTLADSEFTRKDLFVLFLNPCFLAAHHLEREQALAWLQWADQLQVFRALDSTHQSELGLPADGRFTWQRALERLRLGTVMSAPQAADDFRHFGTLVPYSDQATDDAELIGKLSAVCVDLHRTLREVEVCFSRNQICALDVLRALLDRHLKAPADRPGEAGVRAEVFSAIHRLGRHASAVGRLGSFGLFREILSGQVGGVAGSRGNYLAGGITIAALQPMRPIPFRIVYVPGMGESNDFPGHADQSLLNLRSLERRVGDATMPESNRLLFLENFLSVRDRLYITYVSRDVQRDTEFHPCSVVTELKSCLSQWCSGETDTFEEYREARVPLRLTGEGHLFFEATDESDALACYSPADRVLALRQFVRKHPDLPARARHELKRLIRERGRSLSVAEICSGELTGESIRQPAPGTADPVYLRDLGDFLKNPIEALLRRRLGLYDEGVALRARALEEDESFYLDASARRRFLRSVLEFQLRQPMDVYEKFFEDARRRDQLPRDAFAELEHATLRREFEQRWSRLNQICGDVDWLPELRWGSGDRSIAADQNRRPLVTPAANLNPESVGGLAVHALFNNFFTRPDVPSRYGVLTLSFADHVRSDDFIDGFLSALLLCGAGPAVPAPYSGLVGQSCEVLVVARKESRSILVDIPDAAVATKYLRDLALDFQAGGFETLPLRLIEHSGVSRKPHHAASVSAKSKSKRTSNLTYAEELRMVWEDHNDDFYQMEIARLLPARFPDDAEEIVRRRYALLFSFIDAAKRSSGDAA